MENIKSIQLVVDENDGNDEKLEAAEVWSLPLPGRLSSNVAAVGLDDGSGIALAAASGGRVRFWLPRTRHGANVTTRSVDNPVTATNSWSVPVCADKDAGSPKGSPPTVSDDQNGRGEEGTEVDPASSSAMMSSTVVAAGLLLVVLTSMLRYM
jgi:hypothetical protein